MSEDVGHLLNQIAHNEIVLPEFQREFTWDRDQSKLLVDSLMEGYPTGSLLLWATDNPPALKNSPSIPSGNRVSVLLDGQQRLTVLYLLIKDDLPPYYSSIDNDPRNLHYNLDTQELKYYKKAEMQGNPRWVKVTDCFISGGVNVGEIVEEVSGDSGPSFELFQEYQANLTALQEIRNDEFPIMHVDDESSLREALTVFDRVNSQGTALSDADIALAHMVSAWPETRRNFKNKLSRLDQIGFSFDLTFLVRSMNAVINQSAEFEHLHDLSREQLQSGWNDLSQIIDYVLNVLRDHAYIYSTKDLNTPYVLIPIIGYLSMQDGEFRSANERNRMLYWMYAALLQRRHTRGLDASLLQDLNVLKGDEPIAALITTLKEEEGDPHVSPENLDMRGIRHPLYNMMQIVIRANEGVDWRNGIDLSQPVGDDYSIQSHHIFPRAQLSQAGYDTGSNHYDKKRVNEIANRVPLTKSGNLGIFDSPPSEYLPTVSTEYPNALEPAFVPVDERLWEMENYEDFLGERRRLIANGINSFLDSLVEPEMLAR
ncbi:hypothetical protein C457_13474 [Haloferax prahovense DSM 18310]|uniref:GmrSD restriction endonucleases N-terminal domain-containing protein n=1 Tax=Haloferax prahovense (strain DSM 18310 / JCM 13924 / TL6) TaxID=1227461 RepID=M0G4F5_HALPT|nr:DUF262 domain-containing protein [Haloferax prahovense]ELZ67050.1 hypothetical protein C457_13474 [Haloferax prahovense DSM 18310]